ncbi:MAG: DNA-directed RNA polymerase subunit B, partial [Nitrososphaerales archaeon]
MKQEVLDTWVVLQDILEREGVARQHLNSYNEFIEKQLQSIVDEVGAIDVETPTVAYKVKLGRVRLGQPRVVERDGSISNIQPLEARLRNLTYASPIYLEMMIEENGIIKDSQFHHIGDLPVMVKSNLCVLSRISE